MRTIESNYEFDSVYDWISYWMEVRKCACDLLAASTACLHRLLGKRSLGDAGNVFDTLHNRYNGMLVAPLSYPREHRPFEKKPEVPMLFNKAKRDYFDGIQNYANQLISFIKNEETAKRLAICNLKSAIAALPNVQKFFDDITLDSEHQSEHEKLCVLEENVITETYMCCEYYLSHVPDNNYSKYQVKTWFLSSRKAEIEEVNSVMTELTYSYDAVLPKSSYYDNTFMCYPTLLKKFDPANIWLGRIADIGEELWMYSRNREYLIDEEDKQYLSDNLNEIKNRIDAMVKCIEPNVSADILSMVNELCNAVYQGDSFDDEKYNELISYIQGAHA